MNKFLAVIIIFLISSCGNKETIRKREISDKKEFISVLIDVHIADGLIQERNLRSGNKKADSVSLYNYVLKKHNISREKFIKTVDYYTVHTDEYLIIYDSVQSNLKKKEKKLYALTGQKKQTDLTIKKDVISDSTELWNMKKEWSFPKDGEKNPIPFKINIRKQGTYVLKARIKIFPDDKTVKQRMTIIANYSDGTKDVNSNGTMVKDGNFENYEVSISTNPEKNLISVSGWLFDHSKGTLNKHAQIKNVSLKRIENNKNIIK